MCCVAWSRPAATNATARGTGSDRTTARRAAPARRGGPPGAHAYAQDCRRLDGARASWRWRRPYSRCSACSAPGAPNSSRRKPGGNRNRPAASPSACCGYLSDDFGRELESFGELKVVAEFAQRRSSTSMVCRRRCNRRSPCSMAPRLWCSTRAPSASWGMPTAPWLTCTRPSAFCNRGSTPAILERHGAGSGPGVQRAGERAGQP